MQTRKVSVYQRIESTKLVSLLSYILQVYLNIRALPDLDVVAWVITKLEESARDHELLLFKFTKRIERIHNTSKQILEISQRFRHFSCIRSVKIDY